MDILLGLCVASNYYLRIGRHNAFSFVVVRGSDVVGTHLCPSRSFMNFEEGTALARISRVQRVTWETQATNVMDGSLADEATYSCCHKVHPCQRVRHISIDDNAGGTIHGCCLLP